MRTLLLYQCSCYLDMCTRITGPASWSSSIFVHDFVSLLLPTLCLPRELIGIEKFGFEVQDKDKKGLLCTLSKLAILSTSTIQESVDSTSQTRCTVS